MPTPCNLNTPTVFESDPCNGEVKSAACVRDSSLYSELGLTANATQQEINQALYLAVQNLKATVVNLQSQIDNL